MSKTDISIENIIMDNLILNINEGRYLPDEKLPSDNELSDKYGVPRIKIRHVYERLEAMGYIYSLQGRGRFLKNRNENIELILSGKESFSKKIIEQGYELESKNIFCERVPYNEKIYGELRAEKKDEIYRVGRLRIVGGEAIAIHISYVLKSVFPNIYEDGKKITSMFEYYNKNGFSNYSTEKSFLSIAYPTSKERGYLECGELVPVLKLETNCRGGDGSILEYTEIMYRGDRFRYQI
ncbi:GntR family transcriptional regulator [Clostridium paraputrificum]|uniref:GntR family transcriptional regulator n=1 Tax=Clostridium TaxID=1485 RepID=UPI003D34A61E